MKKYSDSTLMRMTKADLIEQLRCAEHNREVAEKTLAQQAENLKDWKPVVHCKDCKYYNRSELLAPNKFCFRLKHPTENRVIGYNFALDDFCSYGERKNTDENESR